MIKITKEGKLPKKDKILFTAKCSRCNCEFEFEIEDFTKIEKRLNGDYFINCPYCNYEIQGKYEYFNPKVIAINMEGEN